MTDGPAGQTGPGSPARPLSDTVLPWRHYVKTNNQASFGGSILKANMEVEAAIELAHDLDETGIMPCLCIGVGLLGFARFA